MSEHDQQVAVVQWFRIQYPKHKMIAIPQGQWIAGSSIKGKYALIAKYKREGWTSGVSDLFICHSDGQNCGLWLEMKDKGKNQSSLSQVQKEWLVDMKKAGYLAKWASGADKAIEIITDYMNGYYSTFKEKRETET